MVSPFAVISLHFMAKYSGRDTAAVSPQFIQRNTALYCVPLFKIQITQYAGLFLVLTRPAWGIENL